MNERERSPMIERIEAEKIDETIVTVAIEFGSLLALVFGLFYILKDLL